MVASSTCHLSCLDGFFEALCIWNMDAGSGCCGNQQGYPQSERKGIYGFLSTRFFFQASSSSTLELAAVPVTAFDHSKCLALTTFREGSSFSAAAATPRLDVEKTPQAVAALVFQDECSQVTSRYLFQKHPANDFGRMMEERKEEKKIGEDGRSKVVLVRGLTGNTLVVRCGVDWIHDLPVRTSVPSNLFSLVVDGRVLQHAENLNDLGRDQVISMRGRFFGGSRNVTPILGEWTSPGCFRPGCWPAKNTCFRCGL